MSGSLAGFLCNKFILICSESNLVVSYEVSLVCQTMRFSTLVNSHVEAYNVMNFTIVILSPHPFV